MDRMYADRIFLVALSAIAVVGPLYWTAHQGGSAQVQELSQKLEAQKAQIQQLSQKLDSTVTDVTKFAEQVSLHLKSLEAKNAQRPQATAQGPGGTPFISPLAPPSTLQPVRNTSAQPTGK